jgi:hypothetical protein
MSNKCTIKKILKCKSDDKVCNPLSGRCISINNSVYKKLSQKQKDLIHKSSDKKSSSKKKKQSKKSQSPKKKSLSSVKSSDIKLDFYMKKIDKCIDKKKKLKKEIHILKNELNDIKKIDQYEEKKSKGYIPKYKYVSGPYKISYFINPKINKKIYLMYENNHADSPNCKNILVNNKPIKSIDITKYLENVFTQTNVFIDFYAELSPPIDKEFYPNISKGQTLFNIYNTFDKCLNYNKTECQYNNTRMHGIDNRNLVGDTYTNSPFSDLLMYINRNLYKKKKKSKPNLKNIRPDILNLINKMSNIKSIDDLYKIIYDDINNSELIKKELYKSDLDKKTIFKIYKTYFFYWFENKDIFIEDIALFFKHINIIDISQEDVQQIIMDLREIGIGIMDVYTISRMFKTFNVKEGVNQPEKQDNIIYYAGGAHTVEIEYFLNNLGFTEVSQTMSDHISCVDISPIKHPLFKS